MRVLKRLVLVLLVSSVVVFFLSLFIYKITLPPAANTQELIEQLGSFDWEVRSHAAKALGLAGDREAVRPLVGVLKDDDSDVRQKAAEALDKLGWQAEDETERTLYFIAKKDWDKCTELNGTTVEVLIRVLRDKDPQVRKKAAEALGLIENPAINPLVAALRDDNQKVRDKAAEALIKIDGVDIILPFISALKDARFYTREKAAESLGVIGDIRAVGPLVAALGDTNWQVREKAAEALGRIGDGSVVVSLVVALKDDDSDVRQKAAEALDRLGWRARNESQERIYFIAKRDWDKCVELNGMTTEALSSALADKNPQVRRKAAETLVKLGGLRTIGPLIVALEHNNSEVRKKAAESLGRIGDSRAVKPLISTLRDNDPDIRKAAAGALVKIGGLHTMEPLIAALKDRDGDVREAAAEILGKISNPALEPLIAALWDENREVREEAAKTLGKLGDSRAVNPLIVVLKYKESRKRQKTTEDLGEMIRATGVLFIGPSVDAGIRLRIEVIKALGQIGDKRAIPALVRKLQCRDTAQAAIESLERLGWSAQSTEDKVHFLVAKKDGNALRQNWEQTRQVLLKDMKSDENEIVKNALYALIAVGKGEIIKKLIDTLGAKGDRVIAEIYHNCGNRKLISAAQDWAAEYKYYFSTNPSVRPVGWGSW